MSDSQISSAIRSYTTRVCSVKYIHQTTVLLSKSGRGVGVGGGDGSGGRERGGGRDVGMCMFQVSYQIDTKLDRLHSETLLILEKPDHTSGP